MTAFVLGATGFVGREVVRQLCTRGAGPVAHVRPDSKTLVGWRKRLEDLEQRLGLRSGELTPKNVVIYICGLTGTITGTIVPLIDRGFIPDFKRIREALGVPADAKDSVFYEQYDTEPVIDIKNPVVVEPLRARMQAALAKL